MERIKFFNLTSTINIVAIIVMFILVILNFIFLERKSIYGLALYSFLVIYFTKMLWFKNYIEWNKKGATLKLDYNPFKSKTIKFENINAYTIDNKILKFEKENKKIIELNISKINKEDIQKLDSILSKYI